MADTSKTIFVVDDSMFMRKLLTTSLEDAGYKNIVECENGAQCLEKVADGKPDLIFLDLVMPEMGGLDVLKEIGKQLNIVVVSAVGQDQMIEEAKGHGAKGYVVKPFEKQQVLDVLQGLFGA